MKRKLSSNDVKNQYVQSGLILRETSLSGDYKKGNAEGEKLLKVFKILEEDIELALNSLPPMLTDENVVTKTKVAAHCISLNICLSEAERVLEEVAAVESDNIFGFNAEMTLKSWRKQGYLKVYPKQELKKKE